MFLNHRNNGNRNHRSPHARTGKALAILAVSSLLLSSIPVFGEDEIMLDDSPDVEEPAITIPEESPVPDESLDSSGLFIEDSGSSSQPEDGISMEDLEDNGMEPETEWGPDYLDPADPVRIRESLDILLKTDSPTGSEGELTVAAYIEQEMRSLGFTTAQQPFHEGFLNVNGIDAPGVNVIAERGANSSENRTRDILLIVTHYDSVTLPEEGLSEDGLPSQESPADSDVEALQTEGTDTALSGSERSYDEKIPVPSGNDKSGTAVLLETARILAEEESDTDLCFLFLSGQEDGGYGAKAFINSLGDESRSRIKGVLAVDHVGYDTGMPNVLKTLTGENNALTSLIRGRGLRQEAALILDGVKPFPENPTDQEDLISGEDGQGLSESAEDGQELFEETEDEADIGLPDIWSCLADPYVEPEDADPVRNPDRNSIQSIFANAQFSSAGITQYDPETDHELYRQMLRSGLAESTYEKLMDAVWQLQNDGIYDEIDTFNDVEIIGLEDPTFGSLSGGSSPDGNAEVPGEDESAETETETEETLPQADPVLLARDADVLAETIASIMRVE